MVPCFPSSNLFLINVKRLFDMNGQANTNDRYEEKKVYGRLSEVLHNYIL